MVFVLGILQISPLGVAVSYGLEEKREEWLRRCRRALDLHRSIWFLLRKWAFNPSQPPHSKSTPRHSSILGNGLCVPVDCLSLEALTTAQLTGMWCCKQGNFSSRMGAPFFPPLLMPWWSCGSSNRVKHFFFCEKSSWTAGQAIILMFTKIILYLNPAI